MNDFSAAFAMAAQLVLSFDPELVEIVLLSLYVSLSSVALAALFGLPLGATIGMLRFPGRRAVIVMMNALMGLPPVVVGLVVYMLLSRAGPLGEFGLLFTPTAMIIAQFILVAPIVSALSRQVVEDLHEEYGEHLRSLDAGPLDSAATLLWDGRFRLLTAVLAGFGRAIAEVGAVLIVGGNILHHTRVMTTTIALETSKGNLALALALGMILIVLAAAVNAAASILAGVAERQHG
ncbi:ABC transporter permease [Thioalkalivibrio sp. XN279]|uniref:ABC transporter permease n=1 Tax=Thioalkalivibrio sp. XN279 TaxID=2714953 RepID=UPI00140E324A|nr:ABC transporter permease [Thioalkalivibrio sp. XN279]NHA15956.1 ABC transporter permease subunit [Thioalkalivibrio sp. XN279]